MIYENAVSVRKPLSDISWRNAVLEQMIKKKIKLKNGQIMIIREAEKKDASILLDYINLVAGQTDYLTFGPGELGLSVVDEEKFIENYLHDSNKLLIMAKIGDEVVGTLGFEAGQMPRLKHRGEFGVTVRKEYWSLGTATSLIRTLIDWAEKSCTIRKINLRVRKDNRRAINLYKKLGFTEEGLLTREQSVNGKFYDCLLLGLPID
jgi:RimJ/RimL family protein N-acetyltransferase